MFRYDGTNWVADLNYYTYSNDFANKIGHYNNILARKLITAESLIVGDETGYEKVASGVTFNLAYPIVWCTAKVEAASSNYNAMFLQHYDRNIATGAKTGFTSTANKVIYLIVTVNDNIATIDSNIITDTLPSSADGKVYISLGKLGAQSTGANYFFLYPTHSMFEYKNGKIRTYEAQQSLNEIDDADDLKAIEAISETTGLLKKTATNTWTLDTSDYVTSSGITSVTIGATSPVQSSTSTAQNGSSASTTISLKDAYGDTKNPYGAKAKNLVLAGPSSGSNAAPTFRALVAADIPDISETYVKKVTSTDNAIARFDGTAGAIQNSGVIIDDNNNISVSSILSNSYSGYNLCKLQTSASGTEIVIKTKFKFVSSSTMPSIRIHGYSYGKGVPLDLTIVYYIYSNEFYVPKVISTGGISPDIYLFTYTEDSIKYVAIGIKSSLGYLGFTVDANGGALGGLNINSDSILCTTGWTIEHNGSNTSNTLIPAVNTDNCKLVPYLALSTTVEKTISANLTSTTNAVAYYTNTTGTFGSKASANGALYATSANGALQWGTLPIAQGGTGKTTANDAANALISSLPTWTASPTADTYFIRRDTGGTSTFGQVKFSSIANITNGKITLGPYSITPVTSVNGHTGSSVSVTAAYLDLSKAMRFIGVATVAITDGSTTDPVISGYSTKTAGDVIIDKDSSREYVWSTTGEWELLGGDESYWVSSTDTAAKFWRGDNKWSNEISGGTLKITNNSNTVTIGSQNASFTHIYNSATIPFIFNNSVLTTTGNLGSTTYPFNNLYIGLGGAKGIYYVGTKSTNQMITFVDNTSDTYGNGIKIGGGGVTVVGAGESAASLSVSANNEALYLVADGTINIEAGGDTIANRIGLQVTTAGHIIPVKAESANNNKQNLGASDNKWANVYASTLDSSILKLHQGTAADPSLSGNARIEFDYGSGQPVVISYTPNDGYRAPAGLKVMGGTSATPAWFEVEGNIYAAAFKGNADTATSAGKWTTARDISVSDSDGTNTGTAVSVDGSEAVTLKLPATIKADLTGNASTVTSTAGTSTLAWGSEVTLYTVGGAAIKAKLPSNPNSDHYTSAWCDTAAGTQAKAAYCTNYTLTANTWLHVLIKNANTYNGKITLNVNSTGAKDIWINGAVSSSTNKTLPAGTYLIYYDGTKYQFRTDGQLPGNISGSAGSVAWDNVSGHPTNLSQFTNDSGYVTSSGVSSITIKTTSPITGGSDTATTSTGEYTIAHATGDGNLHVPATGTTNNGKVLKAGSTAGSISWGTLSASDVGAAPSSTVSCTTANVKTALGTGSGTTKFLREDGTWQTPAYIANSDEKLKIAAVTSGTTYYPIVAANSTAAANRQYDATGLAYLGTNGTTSAVGVAKITLGNSTASGTANNKQGSIGLYGSTAYLTTIISGAPTAANTLTLPTATGTFALTSDLPTTVSKTAAGLCPILPNETTTTKFLCQDGNWVVPSYIPDTHHTAYLRAGAANGTANETTTTGNTYLLLVENSTHRSGVKLVPGSNMSITSDASGNVTFTSSYTNTLNTAGSTDSTSKLYLIGATSQAANPQTYSDSHVFETNGAFSAKTLGVNADTDNDKVTLQWNSTDSSLDFVFA